MTDVYQSFFTLAVRIRSGESKDTYQGHVEVNKDGKNKWLRLQSLKWTMEDANVVCKEVGHEPALEFTTAEHYMNRKKQAPNIYPENKDTHPWNKECDGSEYSILRCKKKKKKAGESNTSSPPDAGVGVRCKYFGKKHYTYPCSFWQWEIS